MLRELETYINEKGWNVKPAKKGQLQLLDECPFCGKVKHLYFDQNTGLWKCLRCGESGNLLVMKRLLGDLKTTAIPVHQFFFGARDSKSDQVRPPVSFTDKANKRLWKDKQSLSYLTDIRGFSTQTIQRFKLGLIEKKTDKYLVIPHFFRNNLVNVKFRSIPPAKKIFVRWPGCPSILFNSDSLIEMKDVAARDRVVFLCEGETDAIALAQMGFRFVVSSTAGAGSWQQEWLKLLEPATTIFLFYDSDEAGEAGAEKAASILGKWRCKRAVPLLHDCAEMVAAGLNRQDFDRCIHEAKDYKEGTIKTVSAFTNEMKGRLTCDQPRGRPTGWSDLDVILGGLRSGELTIVTGDTGSGKSTWCINLGHKQLHEGCPVFLGTFEQKPWEAIVKLTSQEAEKSSYNMTAEELDAATSIINKLPLYFMDVNGSTPLQTIKDAIFHAVHRFGVELVILDHLHYFLDCDPENERHAIDQAVRSLKKWAVDLGIHIVLVVHPKTLRVDAKGNIMRPTINDLKGSSEIKKEADNIILVWRDRSDDVDFARAEIAVLKCRSPAGTEGRSWYYFNTESETFISGAPPIIEGSSRRRKKKTDQSFSGRDAASGEYIDTDGDSWDEPY